MSYSDLEFEYDYLGPKDRVELMAEGQGVFRINQVIPKVSKSGNKMLEVLFVVRDMNGREWRIYDYLIATKNDEDGMKRLNTKIGNIAKAINKPEIDSENYNKRNLIQDLLGHKGKCYVKIQEDKTGQYSDKNVIAKFLPWENPQTDDAKLKEFYDKGGDDLDTPF